MSESATARGGESMARAEVLTGNRRATVSERVREHAWELAVWGAMAVWTIVLYSIVRGRYEGFLEGRFDLGNMVQAVWSTAHGHPLEITSGPSGEQMIRLGGHVDPFLVLLAPVWIAWSSPLALALAQIVAVSLGALPVFWLARRHLESSATAGLLALAYLAYPWVATSAGAPIHPVTFAIPFYLYCVWFLDTERLLPFSVFALLAMSTGELMGLPIVALGVWYALARGRRRAGAAITLAGSAWTLLSIYVVVPHFAGSGSIFYGFYDQVGGSPQGVMRMLVTHPGTVLGALVEIQDIAYLLWLGIPLLFLFLLSPGLAAVALPQLLANGLSDFRSMTDPRYHSVAAVIPFLIAATVLGIRRLDPGRRTLAAAAVLVCSGVLATVVAPWPRAVGSKPLDGTPSIPAPRLAALREAVALVPSDARVSASNAAGSQLSARRYVYSIPLVDRATWVVVDTHEPWVVSRDSPILTKHPERVRALVGSLRRSPDWALVFDREGVLVFRRSSG